MAINTTRLATGLGKIFGGANEINTYRGTTVPARVTTLITQLSTATNDILTGVYDAKAAAKASESGWIQYLGSLVSALIIDEVNLDRNIPNDSIVEALTEWKRQMLIAGDTFNDSPVTLTLAAVGSPTGSTYTFVRSTLDETGVAQDLIVPDVYLIQTTADKDHGGTRWAETFSLQGKQADAAETDDTYPTGTGLNTTVTVHDPANGSGLVTDPGFDNWATNTPTDWVLGPSTLAGTHVFKGSDDPRDGVAGNCLRLVGDGAVIPKLRFRLTSVGANDVLAPHLRLKKVVDAGTDWMVSLRLVDSTGAVLTGPNGYSNSGTSNASTSITADWANVIFPTLVLPNSLPADGIVYLEIVFSQNGSVTTAPIAGAEVYVDHVDVVNATQLYPGGPHLTAFSGYASTVVGDAWTLTVALAAGTMSSFMIRWLDRFLDLKGLGIRMPTVAGGETQVDALIS